MDRLMRIVLCLGLISCRTVKKDEGETSKEVEEVGEGGTMAAQEEPAPTAAAQQNLAEPSPRELNRLYTWLAEQETGFDLERLEDCEAQLLVRADRVQNKSDIQKAANDLLADVRDTLALYHWCYFHMLSRLEYQLEQENLGRTWQDKLQQFLRESKALFIVAESLDRTRQSRSYRSNLQKKYIALSQAFFGRKLSPVESAPREKKPASPFNEQ